MDSKSIEIKSQAIGDLEEGVIGKHHGNSKLAWRGFALLVVAFLMFWYRAPASRWINVSSAFLYSIWKGKAND
jgi:hypothetical protein